MLQSNRSAWHAWTCSLATLAALCITLEAHAGVQATAQWAATFSGYGGGSRPGPQLPIQPGEGVEIVAVFDPTVTENPATVGNPTLGLFTQALISLEIFFVTSDVRYRFGPGGAAASQINLLNDSGAVGISLTDQFSIVSADSIEAPIVQNASVLAAAILIGESINAVQGGGIPDLLTSSATLPVNGLDLDTPGFLISNASITYDGFDPTSLIFANVTQLPEPGALALATAALLTVAGLRNRSGS